MIASEHVVAHAVREAPGWWRRWPQWIGCVAAAWSLIYGALGLWWALGGAGFPFGRNDSRAEEVGSLFSSAEPGTMEAVIAGLGLLGVVALAMTRSCRGPWAWLPLAWAVSAVLIVVVPDIRVVQNFAYTGLWDWPLFFMLFCMAGGVLWAATALAYRRRMRQDCECCGRGEWGGRVRLGGPLGEVALLRRL